MSLKPQLWPAFTFPSNILGGERLDVSGIAHWQSPGVQKLSQRSCESMRE